MRVLQILFRFRPECHYTVSLFAFIDPFNVCKHRKPRMGACAAWGQKNGAANRPAYCVKETQQGSRLTFCTGCTGAPNFFS